MPHYEDFTDGSWIESDTPNRLTQGGPPFPSSIWYDLQRDDDSVYLWKDFGVGRFGDFEHRSLINLEICPLDAVNPGRFNYVTYCNNVDDWEGNRSGNFTQLSIFCYTDAANRKINLLETHAGVPYFGSNPINISAGIIPRYNLVLVKSGISVTLSVYDRYWVFVGSTSLTLQADHKFQYILIPQSLDVAVPANASAGHLLNFEFRAFGALPCGFFVLPYRTPAKIDKKVLEDPDTGLPTGEIDRAWGGILCIDPNGLREDQKGPIFFLLDTLVLRPGLTDKAGVFSATINDNKTEGKRIYDKTLFVPGTPFIRDNDEFWVGVQQGPETLNNSQGLVNNWTEADGGRWWFMGGWIRKRHYEHRPDRKVIAKIEGTCYMELWYDSFFGTLSRPRNYIYGSDLSQIVADLLSDVNERQDPDYGFTGDAGYFPAVPLTSDASFYDTIVYVQQVGRLTPGLALIWDDETLDPLATEYIGVEGEIVTIIGIDPVLLEVSLALPGIRSVYGYQVASHAKIMMVSDKTGLEINKEYKEDEAFLVMRSACEQVGWEWQIIPNPGGATPAERRAVMFYERSSSPLSDQPLVEFSRNIRGVPDLMIGDSSNLITNIIVTGEKESIPPDPMMWIESGLWPDINWANRRYIMLSVPPPPNARSGAYTDGIQVMDDEGWPAICFQRTRVGAGQFWMYLSFYTDEHKDPIAGNMDIDLRKWRRIKLKFKHNSRASPDAGTTYEIWLHTLKGSGVDRFNHKYEYDFGTGAMQDNLTWIDGGDLNDPPLSDHDTIDDTSWAEIDLLLPEINADKSVSKLHGWNIVGDPEPDQIDFISFKIECAEDEPGKSVATEPGWTTANTTSDLHSRTFLDRVKLSQSVNAGDYHIRIPNPHTYFGWTPTGAPETLTGEKVCYNPKPLCILGDKVGNSWEYVEVDSIWDEPTSVTSWPNNCNIRLKNPVQNAYTGTHKYLYIVAGWSISFSQLRFERNVIFEKESTLPLHLQNPKRYRITDYNEIEYSSEAEARADQELLELGLVTQFAKPDLDGDPRHRIGYRLRVRFDPERSAAGETDTIFHDIYMVIDNVQYVMVGVDFRATFTLGTMESRGRELEDAAVMGKQNEKIHRVARKTTPLGRGILRMR